jgi:hypothetical protein
VRKIFQKYFIVEEINSGVRVNALNPQNFTSIEKNRVKNHLKLLARTDVLIGPHGAGLAHAIYLQKNSLFVRVFFFFNYLLFFSLL